MKKRYLLKGMSPVSMSRCCPGAMRLLVFRTKFVASLPEWVNSPAGEGVFMYARSM